MTVSRGQQDLGCAFPAGSISPSPDPWPRFAIARTIAHDLLASPNRANCVDMAAPAQAHRSRASTSRVVREGIQLRHSRRCGLHLGIACSCTPSYQAQVWSNLDQKPIRKTLPTLAAALAWRQESQVALRRGTMRAPTQITVCQAAEEWLAAADAGIIRTRSGDPYKPSALRSYRQALRQRVLPQIGSQRLSAVTRNQIQDLVDRLVAKGLAPSTVRNSILPLRAIYRRAHHRDEVPTNPTLKLSLPAVHGRRDQIADPTHAAALIEALPETDQALWATAFYSGLRRGELQALTWSDIDLQAGLIHVNGSWDMRAGPISPKSRAGRRRIPLTTTLRRYLAAHHLRKGRPENGYVFANSNGHPFDPTTTTTRARKTWNHEKLEPLTLHECRHSYAAFMIAAGVNAKALSTYMGHSTITTTLDRYGHLLPGNETHAANLLEGFLTPEEAVS